MVDASQRPILPAEQRVAPQVFMVWAHRHLENFPEELKAFYPTPSDSELNPQEQIRVLKRELSYAAVRERNLVALIVLLINFPDHLKRGKTLGMARLLRARDKVCKALGKDKLGFQNQDNLFLLVFCYVLLKKKTRKPIFACVLLCFGVFYYS